jgi:hypothetical protein
VTALARAETARPDPDALSNAAQAWLTRFENALARRDAAAGPLGPRFRGDEWN